MRKSWFFDHPKQKSHITYFIFENFYSLNIYENLVQFSVMFYTSFNNFSIVHFLFILQQYVENWLKLALLIIKNSFWIKIHPKLWGVPKRFENLVFSYLFSESSMV